MIFVRCLRAVFLTAAVAAIALLAAMPALAGHANPALDAGPAGRVSVGEFLAPDGRVDMDALRRSGYEGNLDMAGFRVRLDGENGPPVLMPEAQTGREPGDEYWSYEFAGRPGMNETVNALTVYNGEVIAGGTFTEAGDVSANRIARWDGSAWHPLGSGMSGGVGALTVYNGDLIAAGSFTHAGGETAQRIARWDGFDWHPLGSGMSGGEYGGTNIVALTEYNGDLIAGGNFWQAGGTSANYIARWDGTAWHPLGSGMNETVNALTVYSGDLIVGGWFTHAGGVSANRIASWDGMAWFPLGSGMTSTVYALAVYNGDLIAGGWFTQAGGVSANRIARWNGAAWHSLGPGRNDHVYALTVFNGDLIAGGQFTNRIARWDGSAWHPLGSGMSGGVGALTVYNGDLIAGGWFTEAGGVSASRIAAWSGDSWFAIGWGKSLDNTCRALLAQGAQVYAGGEFHYPHGAPAACPRVAMWDGDSWNPLGTGMNDAVRALAWGDGLLYAGGSFTQAGGQARNRVASWDGNSWSALGTGVNGLVNALVEYDGNMIAAGEFTQAGGQSAGRIASWDGSSWSPLGIGFNSTAHALAVYNGDLYAGGAFSQAGGQPARRVARWDGSEWSSIGILNGPVYALLVHGDRLYAGGEFTEADGVAVSNIAAYDGTEWVALDTGVDGSVRSLASAGGFLFVGGEFAMAGGIPASRIAKWDGAEWSVMGSGANASVLALASDGARIYAGGEFTMAGGKSSGYFGRWDGLLGPCSITVTQPGNGDVLTAGDPVDILWTHGGVCGQYVQIDLLLDGHFCARIADSAENDGLFTWMVESCDDATTGYSISVTDLDSGAMGVSSGTFEISLSCIITVTSPAADDNWLTTQVHEISWESLPYCGESVQLTLLLDGEPCATIAESAPNTGSFLWEPKQCSGEDAGYQVVVMDLTTGEADTSGVFRISLGYEIISITDFPNDQGRQVRVKWSNALQDSEGSETPVTAYSIFRRIDQFAMAGSEDDEACGDDLRYPPGDWEFVKSVPAFGEETYTTVCPTACDSTVVDGMCWSVFFVRAGTANPLVFFDTAPDSGYSVDNLAPNVPQNLRFESPALLAWDESEALDFNYFTIYGSNSAELDHTASLIGYTTGTMQDVSGHAFLYFHVTATDFSGNEGEAATIENLDPSGVPDAGRIPARFSLRAPAPNPTTGGVLLAFDLPAESRVALRVHDAGGRLVTTIVDGQMSAGTHTIAWDCTDSRGRPLGTGVYFCRMDAPGFSETRKVIVAR